MKKICIFDLNNTGHHWFYNFNLMKGLRQYDILYYTSNLNDEYKNELNKLGIKFYEVEKKEHSKYFQQFAYAKELYECLLFCKKNDYKIFINIYFDNYILSEVLLKYFVNKLKVYNTLHWFPNNKIKFKIIKLFSKSNKFIVHTQDVKAKLNNIGCKNVNVINYPVKEAESISKNEAQEILNIQSNKFKLLYFGGTRIDKGIDILLQSLKKVTNINKILLIIAGKEEEVKREFIIEKLQEVKDIEYRLDLKYIEEDMVEKYFIASDLVVLPYRKIFNGESGIITEALNNGTPVIAPDIIHFKDKIGKCGLIYECENINSLSNTLDEAIGRLPDLTHEAQENKNIFRNNNSLQKFIEKYLEVISGE